MYVAEYREANFSGLTHSFEKLISRVKAHGVQPGAAHNDRRMMETNHDMFGVTRFNRSIESIIFIALNSTARAVRFAAVDANDQPVAGLIGVAIKKGRCVNRPLHEIPNIVIAWYAVHWQLKSASEFLKTLISRCAVVLNQVSGNRNEGRLPTAVLIVLQNSA